MSRLKWLTALLVQHYEGFHPDLVALNRQPTNQRRVKREIYRKHRRNAPSLRSTTQFFSHLFVYLFFSQFFSRASSPNRAPTERKRPENDPWTSFQLVGIVANQRGIGPPRVHRENVQLERQSREKKEGQIAIELTRINGIIRFIFTLVATVLRFLT